MHEMGTGIRHDMTLGEKKLATAGHAHMTASRVGCRGCSLKVRGLIDAVIDGRGAR